MEEHLSTDTSDPISVIKDYIRSHLSAPELGRTSIADKIHMNPDYLSHIFSTKTGVQKKTECIGIFRSYALCFISYPQKSARSSFR